MDVNAAVPRTSEAEGLSVVSSLSEVSHQIAIAEEIPTEHDHPHPSVFPSNDQVSSEEVEEHQQCEVQVVKVANVSGGVNITFSTPALANLARVGEESEDNNKVSTHCLDVFTILSVDSGGGTYVTEAGTVIESGDLQGNVIATSGTHVAHLPIIRGVDTPCNHAAAGNIACHTLTENYGVLLWLIVFLTLLPDLAASMVTVSAGNSVHPQTPMTPLTPMTPMTPTCITPVMVTSGLQFGTATQGGSINIHIPTDPSLDQKRHWWHIEEMVNSLLSTATQLKCMLEQVKLQSEAAREAAVAQAKLQAESEKKEVLAQTRMNSLLQLSKAINDAQAEREQAIAQALMQAKADKLEAVAEARQEQLIKV
ncbi:hypothetical protein QZH41_009429 [Actinostola sp. cb2023]|nr:hypothetical protein QZH41_009429 [Actinostola sp. cb2023]